MTTLVICEKPSAARRIATALDDHGDPEAHRERNVPYFVAKKGDKTLFVATALGHLYTITQAKGKWTYPIYDTKWVPAYKANKNQSHTRAFIAVISKLSKTATSHVSACDYDLEGSLIAYMILQDICTPAQLKKARRMKYSTLTDRDIQQAWEKKSTLDLPVIMAGKARHEVDWLFGINLSRALTLSLRKASGIRKTLSIGRVQGPTLAYLKERETEIQTHIPTPYWNIKTTTRIEDKNYPLEYEKTRVDTKHEAEKILDDCRGKDGTIRKVNSQKILQTSHPPFNLSDLQQEAYRKYKYSPRTTQSTAEKLYLSALISYPRTSSQRLPPSIDLKGILKKLGKQTQYSEYTKSLLSRPRLKPVQGKKDDPAHPAIHPTGKRPGKLDKTEHNVYALICRRFMASMDEPAERENITADIIVAGHLFRLKGKSILKKGWMHIYAPYLNEKEVLLPALETGQRVPVKRIRALMKFTKPPSRYNQSSLLKLMEARGIGTKATRTDIIGTLQKRDYVSGNPLRITDLGFTLVETLHEQVPKIVSVEMTRDLEKDLEQIQEEKRTGESVVKRSIQLLNSVLKEFKEKEQEIGTSLSSTIRTETPTRETLGKCPKCSTGQIQVIRNTKTGKRFAGCSNYRNGCKNSYPLPQNGNIQSTGKICPTCNAPVIKVTMKGCKPWETCIDMNCSLRRTRSS